MWRDACLAQLGIAVGTSTGYEPVEVEKGKAILPFQHAAFQRALQHHVKIAFGVDDDPDFLDNQFEALVRGGMTPLQALQSATINAAALLSLSDRIGSLEPGKFADLIGISGDPLSDISLIQKIVFVMKGGALVKNTLAANAKETR